MPGWKRDVGKCLDELSVRMVPDVHKAVKWNEPFYGHEGDGWFLAFRCYTKYVPLQFFEARSSSPCPRGRRSTTRCATSTSTRTTAWTRTSSCRGLNSQQPARREDVTMLAAARRGHLRSARASSTELIPYVPAEAQQLRERQWGNGGLRVGTIPTSAMSFGAGGSVNPRRQQPPSSARTCTTRRRGVPTAPRRRWHQAVRRPTDTACRRGGA